jgi:hypothetical protein
MTTSWFLRFDSFGNVMVKTPLCSFAVAVLMSTATVK